MCLRPIVIKNPNYFDESSAPSHKYVNSRNIYGRTMSVPCGSCMECVRHRQNNLAWLCEKEMESYPNSQATFVTLTYDDKHLPKVRCTLSEVDEETGEVSTTITETPTCSKKSIQNFLKRLRNRWSEVSDDPLRVFWCTEYGSKRHRPHAHLIIFNACPVMVHSLIVDCWTVPRKNQYDIPEPYGFVYVDHRPAGKGSLKYIAKYGCKPSNTVDEDIDGFSKWERENCYSAKNPDGVCEKPVVRHSLRLGYSYLFDEFGQLKQDVVLRHHSIKQSELGVLYPDDSIIYGTSKTGEPIIGTLPKVFRDKIYSSKEKLAIYFAREEKRIQDFIQKLIDKYNEWHFQNPYSGTWKTIYFALQNHCLSKDVDCIFSQSLMVEVANAQFQEEQNRYRQNYNWLKQDVSKSLF